MIIPLLCYIQTDQANLKLEQTEEKNKTKNQKN